MSDQALFILKLNLSSFAHPNPILSNGLVDTSRYIRRHDRRLHLHQRASGIGRRRTRHRPRPQALSLRYFVL